MLLIAAFVRWSGRRAVETVSPFDDVVLDPESPDEGEPSDAPEPDTSG